MFGCVAACLSCVREHITREEDGKGRTERARERKERELEIGMFCSVHAGMEEAEDGNHNFMPWK